ncbi:MAG: RagB/SusD family nutrient uptake outer membrane protein [Bacteroidales bacterium]
MTKSDTGYYGKNTLPVTGGQELTKQDVLSHLKDIINSGYFSLLPDYSDLFIYSRGDFSSEIVFDVPFSDTGNWDWHNGKTGNVIPTMSAPAGYTGSLIGGGWALFIPSQSLAEEFEPGDLRKDATIISVEKLLEDGSRLEARYQHTGMFTNKYTLHPENFPPSGGFSGLNDPLNFHLIRYADVLLMAAELDMGSDAINWINQVRNRAGLGNISSVDIDVIYHERRVELALEGVRYWDVLRRGLDYASEKLTVQNYQMRPPTDPTEPLTGDLGNPKDFERVFDKSKLGFLPIPQYEMDVNTNFVQNAGY